MLSLSSWTIVDPNLTLPLVVFIGILMGFMTLWVLSDIIKISKFVEFLYGYVISISNHICERILLITEPEPERKT